MQAPPKKQARAPRDARVGRWVEVYWAGDGEWFLGRVAGQRTRSGRLELKVAYADGETMYEALRDEPFDGDGEPPAVADGEPEHWRWAAVPPVRKVAIDVDGLVERAVPIRPTGKPRVLCPTPCAPYASFAYYALCVLCRVPYVVLYVLCP